MKIWLYCICRNEEKIMPYFIRHYETFVDRMIFYDDESTDSTREIIAKCSKAFYRPWPGSHGIVDHEFMDFANNQWRETINKADWVIWVDADEFIYHPNILEVLERYLKEGVQVPQVDGFTMLSDSFPTTEGQIYDEVKTGVKDDAWNKCCVFRGEVRFNVGRHSLNISPEWNPKSSSAVELKLLHYRGLGIDYVAWRHARNWERVPQHCRDRNYGVNTSPGWQDHHGLEWFRRVLEMPRGNVI